MPATKFTARNVPALVDLAAKCGLAHSFRNGSRCYTFSVNALEDGDFPPCSPAADQPGLIPLRTRKVRGFRGVSTKTVTFATAFEGITVQLDQTAEQPGRGAHFAGLREFMGGPGHIPGLVQRVHVMSSHAFGEIRSYVLDEARCLRLAGPCYGGEWAEMDNEVARVLAATLHPYKLTAGGSIEE